MLRLMQKYNIKRGIASILAVLMFASAFLSIKPLDAKADSNDLRKTYLNLMAGKDLTDVKDVNSLSTEDLRCVALFLSNYYVPFATVLDDNESDQTASNKTNMVNTLKTIGFKQEAAEQLVENIYKYSLASAKKVYVDVEDPNCDIRDKKPVWGCGDDCNDPGVDKGTFANKNYQEDVGEFKDNKYTPYTMWMWYSNIRDNKWRGGSKDKKKEKYANSGKDTGNVTLYWDNDGTMQPCFQLNNITRDFFVSMTSVPNGSKQKKMAAWKDGYMGNAVSIAAIGNKVTVEGSVYTDDGKDMSDTEAAKTFLFSECLYVDWVGNILVDMGTHRAIVYPAAVNPYAFSQIGDATSTDASEMTPYVNLVSVQGNQFINRFGTYLEYSGLSDDQKTTFNTIITAGNWGKKDKDKMKLADGDAVYSINTDFNIDAEFKLKRGAGTTASWDSAKGQWGKGNGKTLHDLLEDTYEGDGGNNDAWESTDLTVTMRSLVVTKNNSLSQYLIYKQIPPVDELEDDTLGSESFVINDYAKRNLKQDSNFSTYNEFSDGSFKMFSASSADSDTLSNYFVTYAFAYANKDAVNGESYEGNENKYYVNMKFNDIFPHTDGEAITWETSSHTSEKVMSFVYYLLHPVEGAAYVATLFKNKVSGIIVGWHEDTVGNTDSNYTTGMTKYLGFTGYATSPSLYDVDWIAGILDTYNNLIVYVIILLCVILLCYVLIGSLTIQRGIIGVFCFAVLAFLPPVAINASVDMINKSCDAIYSSKFDYWAICQLEGYLPKLNEVTNASTVNDYIAALMDIKTVDDGVGGESEGTYSGVKLKWMTPKRFNDMAAVTNELNENQNISSTFSPTFIHILSNSLASQDNTEEFIQDSLYLYRDYMDIYRYSSTAYNLYSTFNIEKQINKSDLTCLNNKGKMYKDAMTSSYVPSTAPCYNSVTYNWSMKATYYAGSIVNSDNTIKYTSGNNVTPRSFTFDSGKNFSIFAIDANEESDTSSNYSNLTTDIKNTSATNHTKLGFLYNPTGLTSGDKVNYYTQGHLATSLLLNNNYTYMTAYGRYNRLRSDIELGTLNLTPNAVNTKAHYYGLYPDEFYICLNDYLKYNRSTTELSDGDVDDSGFQYDDKGNLTVTSRVKLWKNLSSYYYALYAESPYYYFNFNIRDQVNASSLGYSYNYKELNESKGNITKMFLKDDQSYFYNLVQGSGDGYGELRDFMNMHDFFWYVIPSLDYGNKAVDLFDEYYGMYTYDDCSLHFNNDGTFSYDGEVYKSVSDSELLKVLKNMSDEELFKFWHDFNVNCLFNCYITWLDTMEDCDYAKEQDIMVMGKKYTVSNPLDPTSYFVMDDSGNITDGRYMIFSRSEMKYYGLEWSQLTQVEQKIITLQDNVYEKTLNLMNYYTLSDENIINSYSMIQLFEFNKMFSQSKFIGESYELYPQGYELKAFTYDSYLRLIVAEASGEELQTTDGTSIYTRVISKTSIFFGICLLVNDFIAVYLIPGLKIAFLIALFFSSIALIISSAVKMELNIAVAAWKSLISPLLSYGLISVGMAWIVSLFMSNGAQGVVQTGKTVTLGDPTMAIIAMIIINTAVLVLYWKVVKKCVKDVITYGKALATSIGGAVGGALGTVAAGALKGKQSGKGQYSGSASNSASQRGKDNAPTGKGSSGNLGRSLAGGALGGAIAGDMLSETAKDEINRANAREDARKGMNKYDQKAMEKSEAKEDKYREKMDKALHKAEMAENNGKNGKAERLLNRAAKNEGKMNRAKSYQKNIQEVGRVGAFKKAASGSLGSAASKGSAIAGAVKTKASKGVGAVRSGEVGAKLGSSARKAVNGTKAVGRAISETPTAVRRTASNIKKGAQEGTKKVAKAVGTGAAIGHSIGEAGKETLRNVGNGMSSAYKNNVKGFKAGYQNS